MSKFLLGNVVKLTLDVMAGDCVTKLDLNLADVGLHIKNPLNEITVIPFAPITHDALGIYSYQFQPSMAGIYRIRWFTSGSNVASVEDHFTVLPVTVL